MTSSLVGTKQHTTAERHVEASTGAGYRLTSTSKLYPVFATGGSQSSALRRSALGHHRRRVPVRGQPSASHLSRCAHARGLFGARNDTRTRLRTDSVFSCERATPLGPSRKLGWLVLAAIAADLVAWT